MEKLNHERALVAHLKAICQHRGIELAGFSDDWIFCLRLGDRTTYVFGYDFAIILVKL